MSKYDDGPAFPVFDSARLGTDYGCRDSGMTLRDWFAGQALAGCVFGANVYEVESAAKQCYAIADAMIAERDKE